MKRTQIGSTEIPENQYWSDGRNADRLRQSERELFSMIDLYQEICNYSEDDSIIQEHYGEMDKLYLALKLIAEFGNYPTMLHNAGCIFAELAGSGIFSTPYTDLQERNKAIDAIIENTIDRIHENDLPAEYPLDILDWWQRIVVDQNFYVNLETGERPKYQWADYSSYNWCSCSHC